ncbi:MAG: NAD(P)H-binding protein, partial [Candidatus Nanohaloarchaea archaeon]
MYSFVGRMKILVAGASGFIGRNLVPELLEEHEIRTLGRHRYEGEADKKAVADLRNPEDYRQELEDVDIAYYLAHSLTGNRIFQEKEVEAAESFVEACDEENVDRIIYLSGIQPVDRPSRHLESRRKVGEVLASKEPELTELRASIVLGKESVSFQLMYQTVKKLPVILFPESINSLSQPIYLEDAIHYLVEAAEREDTAGETYDIGGKDILKYREMMEIMAEELDTSTQIIRGPNLPVKMYSYCTRYYTDIDPNLAHSLMESLKHDLTVKKGLKSEHKPLGYREAVKK